MFDGFADPPKRCGRCGCTESRACVDPVLGPCHWVRDDLCSQCHVNAMAAWAAIIGAVLASGAWIVGTIIVWSLRHG